jgi:hypothetical protein
VVAPTSKPAPALTIAAPAPARWVDSGGATLIGPQLAGGTLVLLGGRRALVRADGAVESEKAPTPEPLAEVALVPSGGALRLVGRGEHDVYRFEDPLGAPVLLTRSEAPLGHLGAAPGAVALWTARSDLPRFVDVETGAERALAGLPEPPLRAVMFLDAKRGAGVFEAVGLAVTADGGATWRSAPGKGPRDGLSINGVRRRGDALLAYAFSDGPEGAVDPERGTLGAMDPPAAAAEAATLRWVRASGRDPLEALATAGLELPAGGALAASHGMLARIDARSGAVAELVEVARGKWVPCTAARAAGAAWVACSLPDSSDAHTNGPDRVRAELFDPFGVMRVPLGEPRLTPDKPVLMRNGEAELRVSPSGGVLLTAACGSEEPGQACARQPDGKWKTINAAGELAERGTGPLADGRVAFLRGLFDGDEPGEAMAGEEEDPGRTRRLHVSVLGPGGKEHALAPIPFVPSRGYVHVQSPIEEDADHALHFVIEDGEGPYAVSVPANREAPSAYRIPDAVEARLHGGRGVAVGEGHILASLDGGATWNEVPAPAAALEAARGLATGGESPETFAVSEAGARLGSMLRLGWGPPDPLAEPPAPRAPLATLAPLGAPPAGPELTLTCTSGGAAPGLAPLLGTADARALLGVPPGDKAGPKREVSVWAARISSLETVALLEEEAPAKKGDAPAWALRWHDPREIGGKVRRASVKAPGASGGTTLRFAAADGGRALFAVRSAGKFRLVRVKPAGAAEVVEVAQDLVPSGEVVFGAERGEAIAWLHETHVIVWVAGDRPRVLADLSTHAARTLGAPTAAGVPLLMGASDWALVRTLPLPALDKAAPGAPPPVPATLDGWTRLAPVRRALPTLPACAARAKGARFVMERSGLRAEIDGASMSGAATRYEVRVSGTDVCVEGVAALLTAGKRTAPAAGQAPAPSPGKVKLPAPRPPAPSGKPGFVRVDLVGKKAEGGERGLAPEAQVLRLTCTLAAPKG